MRLPSKKSQLVDEGGSKDEASAEFEARQALRQSSNGCGMRMADGDSGTGLGSVAGGKIKLTRLNMIKF